MGKKNTFKFQTFKERVDSISIDILNKKKLAQNDHEMESFFGAALERWAELNCTELFMQFRKEVTTITYTLKLLLYHKDTIVEKLQQYLAEVTNISASPILDLISSLAADLGEDFYPHLGHFMDLICQLLLKNSQDAEILERGFNCLAHMCHALHRLMIQDMETVIDLFCPLLNAARRDYLHQFGAESLSFLLRKCQNLQSLLPLLIEKTSVEVTGLLLTEMMHGLADHFHSCAKKQVLPLLFSSLTQPHVLEVTKWTLHHLIQASWFTDSHCHEVWSHLITTLQSRKIDTKCGLEVMKHLMKISKKWNCDATQVSQILMDIMKSAEASNLINVCKVFLIKAPESYNRFHFVKAILLNDKFIFEDRLKFANGLIESDYFERDVLVNASTLINQSMQKVARSSLSCVSNSCTPFYILEFFTNVVLKKWSPDPEPSSSEYCQRDFTFIAPASDDTDSQYCSSLLDYIYYLLDIHPLPPTQIQNLTYLRWMAATCLPHIRPVNLTVCESLFKKLIPHLCESFLSIETDRSVCFLVLLTLCELFESLPHLLRDKLFLSLPTLLNRIVRKCEGDDESVIFALRLTDVYLTAQYSIQPDTISQFQTNYFIDRLLSSKHSIRLHSLRILSSLLCSSECEETSALHRVIQRCLSIERVELSVTTYRDVAMHLEHLRANRPDLLDNPTASEITLHYLIGYLNVQFSLVWPSIITVAASFADNSSGSQEESGGSSGHRFWKVFSSVIKSTSDKADIMRHDEKFGSIGELLQDRSLPIVRVNHLLEHGAKQACTDNEDVRNYRHLLWQLLLKMPQEASRKTKLLSPLLIQFIDSRLKGTQGRKSANINRTLVTMLTVYSKFSNIKSVHMEKDLNQWYHRFLCFRDSSVQRAAFNCLFAYKRPELIPYKENFERVLEESTFKDELRAFRLDRSDLIKKSHRTEVAMIMIRLILGRLQTKDKSSCDSIFTYLCSCDPAELNFLIQLLFEPLLPLMNLNQSETNESLLQELVAVRELHGNNTLEEVTQVALGRMQAVCKSVELFLSHLQYQLSEEHLSKLLRLILLFTSIVLGIKDSINLLKQNKMEVETQVGEHLTSNTEENEDENQPVASGLRFSQLKSLRQNCHALLLRFFQIEKFQLNDEELRAVEYVAIEPYMGSLHLECISSPNITLRLCVLWSSSPRFVAHIGGRPIAAIFTLLTQPKLSVCVRELLMEIIHNLMHDEAVCSSTRSMIEPHVASLVTYLSSRIHQLQSSCTNLSNNHRELDIVATSVSLGLINEPAQCSTLLAGLLSHLGNLHSGAITRKKIKLMQSGTGKVKESVEVALLRAAEALFQRDSRLEQHFKRILTLFSRVYYRASRSVMCDIVHIAATRLEQIHSAFETEAFSKIISLLNTWDKRRIEEPDYAKREEAFQLATSMLQSGSDWGRTATTELSEDVTVDSLPPSLYLPLAVANNAVWTLFSAEDSGIRRIALNYLLSLIGWIKSAESTNSRAGKPICERKDSYSMKFIVMDTLWRSVKDGLTLPENRRFEFLELLAAIVKSFHGHPLFASLAKLGEYDDDNLEGDFYENIKSLIIARNAKALRRLTRFLNSGQGGDIPSVLLKCPLQTLIWHCITSSHAITEANFFQAGLDALTALASRLTTKHYRDLLRSVLTKLDARQLKTEDNLNDGFKDLSTAVRVLVAVLDAYNTHPHSATESLDIQDGGRSVEDMDIDVVLDGEEEVEESKLMKQHLPADDPNGISYMMEVIYPKLLKHLSKVDKQESRHKLAQKDDDLPSGKKGFSSTSDKLQVPIAMAMVKLLKKMPKKYLNEKLPRILYRICDYLKSRDYSIRKEASTTLVSILQNLGSDYLNFVVNSVTSQLQRGYQCHVALHVLHHAVMGLEKKGLLTDEKCLDSCVQKLIELYLDELFGATAKDKEEREDKGLPDEARKTKGFDGLQRICRHISVQKVPILFQMLQETARKLRSQKFLKRMEKLFTLLHAKDGIASNEYLDNRTLLIIAQSLATEKLTNSDSNVKRESKYLGDSQSRHGECLLLDPLPSRDGPPSVEMSRTNVHLLIDCGVQMLIGLLKRQKIDQTRLEDLQMLDPFVEILMNITKDKYVKTVTSAVRALSILLTFNLPSLNRLMPTIADQLFKLMSEHAKTQASVGKSKQANQELASILFKTISLLIRECTTFRVTRAQLSMVLNVIDLDLTKETERTATAFSLLKAILGRRLKDTNMGENRSLRLSSGEETSYLGFQGKDEDKSSTKQGSRLIDIMERLRKLAIQSPIGQVREQSRHCLLTYILEYPHSDKQIEEFLVFFLRQVYYGDPQGRVSTCDMLSAIFRHYPVAYLTKESLDSVIFANLISALEQEADQSVRAALLSLIRKLFDVLPEENAISLYNDELMTYIHQENILLVRMVALQVLPSVLGTKSTLSWQNKRDELLQLVHQVIFNSIEQATPLEALIEEDCLDIDSDLKESIVPTETQQIDVKPSSNKKEKRLKKKSKSGTAPEDKVKLAALPPKRQLQILDCTVLHSLRLFAAIINQSKSEDENADDPNGTYAKLVLGKKCLPIWQLIETQILDHSYIQVRRESASLLNGFLKLLVNNGQIDQTKMPLYLQDNVAMRLRLLSIGCLAQFQDSDITNDWCDLVIINLVYLCQLIHLHTPYNPNLSEMADSEESKPLISIAWLLKKLNQESLKDTNTFPFNLTRRSSILKLCASLCLCLGELVSTNVRIQDWILIILSRETRQITQLRRIPTRLIKKHQTDKKMAHSVADELATLVEETEGVVVKLLGRDSLAEGIARVERVRRVKVTQRKVDKEIRPVTNPELAAKRKYRKQSNAVEKKKRKLH